MIAATMSRARLRDLTVLGRPCGDPTSQGPLGRCENIRAMTPPAPEHGDRVGVPASPLDAIVAELAHGRSRAIVDYYYFGPKVEGLRHLVPRLSPGSRILEVGCGRGELGRALAHGDYEVTGVDIDAGSLEIAEARAAE